MQTFLFNTMPTPSTTTSEKRFSHPKQFQKPWKDSIKKQPLLTMLIRGWKNVNLEKEERKEHHKKKKNFNFSGGSKDPDTMNVNVMIVDEKKRWIKDGACFTCRETRHYSTKCSKRWEERDKWSNGNDNKKSFKSQRKKKMDMKQLCAYIRGVIVDNFNSNPEGLEGFLDEVEDKGF